MNTFTENEKASSKAATLLFLSIIFLFVGSSLPFINPVTPRLNSDLMAFFAWVCLAWLLAFTCPAKPHALA